MRELLDVNAAYQRTTREQEQDLAVRAAMSELEAAQEKLRAASVKYDESAHALKLREQALRNEILLGWKDPSTKTITGAGWKVQLQERATIVVQDAAAFIARLAERGLLAKCIRKVDWEQKPLKQAAELGVLGPDGGLFRVDRKLVLAVTLQERGA